MKELETRLTEREVGGVLNFDACNHRIRCYAHIINICSSHIISSVTSVSKKYLSSLKVPFVSNRMSCGDSDDDEDDEDIDPDSVIGELEIDDLYNARGNIQLKEWFAGIKRDPLRRARRIIRLLRSSDQRRDGFQKHIQDGNREGWFFGRDKDGDRCQVTVKELQPLRDVKTRWDSVYHMLGRLRALRPVCLFRDWTVS